MLLPSATIFARRYAARALRRRQPYNTIAMSDTETRRKIALDTLARTDPIIASTPGASNEGRFVAPPSDAADYRVPLPPLDPMACPQHPSTTVTVDGRDSFVCARDILRATPTAKVAVLNLASDERRAGGWLEYLTRTQVRTGYTHPVCRSPRRE